MAPYWSQVGETFEAMSYLIKRANPSETVMHFTDSEDHCRIRGTKKPLRMLRTLQLGGRSHETRHPIYRVLEDYRDTGAFNRKKVRPLDLYILTAGENFGLYNLSREQLTDLDMYYRSVFKTVKPRLTIRFIIFGSSYTYFLNRLEDNAQYQGYWSSITYEPLSSPSKVLS